MSSSGEPAAWSFEPFDKQEEFLNSTDRQVLLSGAFGTGKTLVGCEKGYRFNQMYPGNRGLIVRKTFTDVKSTTVNQTLLEDVIPPSHIVEHNRSEHVIEHYTGEKTPDGEPVTSEIYYHGLDSGRKTGDDDLPRKIGGMEFGWIFVDEASELSKGEWTQLMGRLRFDGRRVGNYQYEVPYRQIFAATNPEHPGHWMYQWFFEDNRGTHFTLRMDDNPHLAEDYVQDNKENYSGVYYDRYILGKWVGAEGLIYDEWKPDTHHVKPSELPGDWEVHRTMEYEDGEAYFASPPEDWRVYRSIDFGYRNPFVCQWWGRGPDDQFVLFRELYKTEELVEDVAKEIKKLDPQGHVVDQSFADWNAEDRATLQRHGVDVARANKDVSPGIQSVKSRLIEDERGKPSLYIMQGARVHEPDDNLDENNDPVKTVGEITGYKWNDSDQEDKPKKADDHGMDAMRYFVHTVDARGQMSEEEMREWSTVVNDAW
jgi:phage terminase large subunit